MKLILINLLVVAGVYSLGYVSSYFFSKRYAMKKKERDDIEKEK